MKNGLGQEGSGRWGPAKSQVVIEDHPADRLLSISLEISGIEYGDGGNSKRVGRTRRARLDR